MIKYSKDKNVRFNQKNHTYYYGEKKLQSVTSYINNYKIPFDSDKIAESYAIKNNLDKNNVLLNWKLKSELSINIGTSCHKIFEDYINNNEIILNNIYEKELTVNKFIQEIFITNKLIPIETEYIVYNNLLAGQIDCIVKNTKNEYFILDWKTNDKINFTSFRNQKMLPPYDNYDDCNFNHYSLQLSIYKSMLLEYNIKDCYIVHIDNKDYKFIKALIINN